MIMLTRCIAGNLTDHYRVLPSPCPARASSLREIAVKFHAEYEFKTARVLSAVLFQENRQAMCKPSFCRLSRSLEDHAAAQRSASVQSQTEAAGTYIGASPHTSRCAGISEMTQGHPHAMASKGGSPNPSYTVAETKTCAAE